MTPTPLPSLRSGRGEYFISPLAHLWERGRGEGFNGPRFFSKYLT